jgi:hypothetical protein
MSKPAPATELLATLDTRAIVTRLGELDAEARALRVLLRAARELDRRRSARAEEGAQHDE